MNRRLALLIGGLAAFLFALASGAQTAAPAAQAPAAEAPAAQAPAVTGRCAKTRDPQRCEALHKAKEACKDKPAAEKRKCVTEAMPPMDCSKARSPTRCEAAQKARAACKDKPGREHRQCIRDHTPKRAGA